MDLTYDAKTNRLTIVIDCEDKPKESASGKSKVLASTHGNQSVGLLYKGKSLAVSVGVNVYTKGL
jgi:hypothetical protein